MIDKNLIPVSGLKREPFSGSHQGMRYYLKLKEDKINFMAAVYPEPWSFEKTPVQDKETQIFPLSGEGMEAAIKWLWDMYKEKKELWQEAAENSMHIVHKKQ